MENEAGNGAFEENEELDYLDYLEFHGWEAQEAQVTDGGGYFRKEIALVEPGSDPESPTLYSPEHALPVQMLRDVEELGGVGWLLEQLKHRREADGV